MTKNAIELWDESKKHITDSIDRIKVKQAKYKGEIKTLENKIENLREDIAYADREDKIYLRQELNEIRDNYDVLKRDADEKDTELFIKSPYFCKVTTDDGEIYISKYKKDLENDLVLFSDKIASLRFYNVDESEKINGHNHTVKEKTDYIIEESILNQLTQYEKDVTYTYDGENTIVIKGEMPKVKKALKTVSGRKIGMQEIIDRMKLEQDTVMRAPELGVTLINGGAGTGKTNIAIHRLRYLLNEFGSMFKEKNMALVCYNVALKEYLNNVIADLNLNNIQVFSYDKWAYHLVKEYSNINYINYSANLKEETEAAYKSSKFADVLFNYVQALKDGIEEEIVNNKILKFYIPENYMFNDIITIQDIFELRNELIDNLELNDEETIKSIDDELAAIMKKYYVREIDFSEKKFILNTTNMLYKVYISQDLKEAFPEVFFYYKPLFQNRANKYELYAAMYLLTLISGDINDEIKIFDHIAVDEAQDFLPIQLRSLKNISTYSMTLAGDVNQKIFNTNINKWDALGIEIDNFYTLKEIHRSTVQTINLANAIIGNNEKNIDNNSGLKPVLIKSNYLKEQLNNLNNRILKIKEHNKDASIVVLYPDSKKLNYLNDKINEAGIDSYVALKDEWDFTKDVSVTNYHQVKGLEFDYVFILGLNEFEGYSYSNKDKVLYTLLTRARERVIMYCHEELPEILVKIDNNLYELKDINDNEDDSFNEESN